MAEPPTDSGRTAALAARVVAFAAPAALSTTQDVVRRALPALTDQADPGLVAEETLTLLATVTARAAEVGLRQNRPALEAAGPALAELPFLYHDFLLGAEYVAGGAEGDVEPDQSVYARLERKAAFYGAHLPPGRFPGPSVLGEKLPLWMGRVSPPKLPTTPDARLADLGVVEMVAAHARLVLAFAQRAAGG
ncbi:hypothetical protein RQM47_15185 [Rubrivirga sp. S365]|uniref:Uncharacterized protein n=1 Tax=Rubrivirga litoralis TaxID=3075598 RepID=A0ABU3BT61_9BACT|nr:MULTISPECIES: hypothetical protein [unclassified Rubrivirga]MDT0632489.1 hypothetical protein [Rubrivirga sp. F394]MDT7857989.1 hypothetical protein [Rubrivirga sp. S365]